jgi:hypothetical protein
VIAPVDLGQALAHPGIYLEPPAGMALPAPAARVRRPGWVRRVMAAGAAVVAIAALTLAGTATGTREAQRPARGSRFARARDLTAGGTR